MQLNWVDYGILAVVVYHGFAGWRAGLPQLLASLVSFLSSLWLAVRFHTPVGNFLGEKFGLPTLWTKVLGYVIVALAAETVISEVLRSLVSRLPRKASTWPPSRVAAAALSIFNGLVIVAFILLVIVALPLRGSVKKDIKSSVYGSRIVQLAERYGGAVTSSLDEVTQEALRFITVQPRSRERIALEVAPAKAELAVDTVSEASMIALVNQEREKTGGGPLRVDERMLEVARRYSRDMFERRYFSHYDPEGHDAGWRMERADISYTIVGENLAYAPDVDTAHRGLMESEGHRRNMLDSQFHRVGIGIIDAGPNGKMFTQVFAD